MEVECFTELSEAQRGEWCDFLACSEHQHPRQDPRFAEIEKTLGRSVLFAIGREGKAIRGIGLLSLIPHPLLPGRWRQAVCLSGPICDDAATMAEFLHALAKHPTMQTVGSLHITPYWLDEDAASLDLILHAERWRPGELDRFRSTGLVDLSGKPEDILSRFSKSARRELRRAERQGTNLRMLSGADEAVEFRESLNRLHASRGLAAIDAAAFLVGWDAIYRHGDVGTILGAFKDGQFLGGLQLMRSRDVAHGRYFTTEPEALRAAGNLRISPALWFEGMLWAKSRGCLFLDVEGYRLPEAGDAKYNIYKYKSELGPALASRISERAITLHPLIHLTGNARSSLRYHLRLLKKRARTTRL